MRKILAAFAFLAAFAGTVAAQLPPPVPALPDTERRTSYAASAQTGPFDVGFAVYGDGSDYGNWLEVWLDGVKLNPIADWTLGLSSGASVATATRPLTNAQVTFTTAQTGVVQIIGARRPRRLSQFNENQGVSARDLNQALTDIIAQNRENWDEVKSRAIQSPPSEVLTVMPPASKRALGLLGFDATGNGVVIYQPSQGSVTPPGVLGNPEPPQGRCTLTSGTPVTQTDVAGATTLFYTPTVGSYAPVTLDGVTFGMTLFAEMSQTSTDNTKSPASAVANSNYDVYLWSDTGLLRISRGAPWTSDTTRGAGAAIQQIAGIWTNTNAITNGPAANRGTLLCSVRTNVSAQFMDTQLFRWVSNVYNAVPRPMYVTETIGNWTYTTAAWRQTNGNAADQVDFLQALAGGLVTARAESYGSNSVACTFFSGVGLNSSTVNSASLSQIGTVQVTGSIVSSSGTYAGYPGLGRNVLRWLEFSNVCGTTTWNPNNASTTNTILPGLIGQVVN